MIAKNVRITYGKDAYDFEKRCLCFFKMTLMIFLIFCMIPEKHKRVFFNR